MHFVSLKFNQIRNPNLSVYFPGSHFFSDQCASVSYRKKIWKLQHFFIIPYCNQMLFIMVLRTRHRSLL